MSGTIGIRNDETGAILVAAAKEDAFLFVKKSLQGYYKNLIYASNYNEAKQKAASSAPMMLIVISSSADSDGLESYMELSVMKNLPAVFVVGEEYYPQIVYRSKGKRIFVLTFPMKRGIVIQAVNIMYETQMMLRQSLREKEKLAEKLLEQRLVSRAKLIMVEKHKMTEDEAHHSLEKMAMDRGLTIKKAAEDVIANG